MDSDSLIFEHIVRKPIMVPDTTKLWEVGGVFSPAVVKKNDRFHMIYRAFGEDRISRFGHAWSDDGLLWHKQDEPAIAPNPDDPQERFGIEDPRIVHNGTHYIISYTAANQVQNAHHEWIWDVRIRFMVTEDFTHFRRIIPHRGDIAHKNDKDGVLFPEKIDGDYWLLHRIEPDIYIARSPDLITWREVSTLLQPLDIPWESVKIGAGTEPIKTKLGWLVFFHGVSVDRVYSMGAFLLDLKDPTRVLCRLPNPLLMPSTVYERQGVVPNVVFGTSALVHKDEIWMYYGAADYSIGVVRIKTGDLLQAMAQALQN